MTPAKNTVPSVPRRLKARRAGLRLVAKGDLTARSLHASPWQTEATAPTASISRAAHPSGGGDLGRSHSAWLDLERP